ncbi:MAG: tRNA (guanosine(46)-N7)-methyltransferase TrmB [Rhodothermaceae bacterium]
MARSKSKKLEEVKNLFNVFTDETENLEKEIREYFGNDNPIILEIGCGEGDYSINLAKKNPDINYVGLDLKGARIFTASRYSKENELKNVCFLMMDAFYLTEKFQELKFQELWVPFSDPFPKKKTINRRLIAPPYLEIYKKILVSDGIVNFKTDDDGLYEYGCEVLSERDDVIVYQNIADIYNTEFEGFDKEIKTKYEKQHIADGKTIKYIKFGFTKEN